MSFQTLVMSQFNVKGIAMITELKQNEFYRCKELLNEEGQLEVKAVVEGVNPGRIFVDSIDSPHSALVWLGNNDGFFLIGNEKMNSLILRSISPWRNCVRILNCARTIHSF